MEGPFPAQGCVLGGLERPFWPSSWDSAHEGTPARETEPAPVTPKRQVPWPAPFPGPAPPAGDSGCSRERRRAPSLAPWGSFFLCVIFGARRLQSLLLAPSFLDPRGAQGRAGSPFAPLALAPRGVGGVGPGERFPWRHLRYFSGWKTVAAPAEKSKGRQPGMWAPYAQSSVRSPCPLRAAARCPGGPERRVLGRRRGIWQWVFSETSEPHCTPGDPPPRSFPRAQAAAICRVSALQIQAQNIRSDPFLAFCHLLSPRRPCLHLSLH